MDPIKNLPNQFKSIHMEQQNLNHLTLLDLVFNYCKKEINTQELSETKVVSLPGNSSLIAEDDPLLYYMSVSG